METLKPLLIHGGRESAACARQSHASSRGPIEAGSERSAAGLRVALGRESREELMDKLISEIVGDGFPGHGSGSNQVRPKRLSVLPGCLERGEAAISGMFDAFRA